MKPSEFLIGTRQLVDTPKKWNDGKSKELNRLSVHRSHNVNHARFEGRDVADKIDYLNLSFDKVKKYVEAAMILCLCESGSFDILRKLSFEDGMAVMDKAVALAQYEEGKIQNETE